MGKPPSMSWVGDHKRWSDVDIYLLEAFREYEKGLCKGCGHPLVLTADEQVGPLDFQVASIRCAGCEALKDNPEAEHTKSGQMFYVVNNQDTER